MHFYTVQKVMKMIITIKRLDSLKIVLLAIVFQLKNSDIYFVLKTKPEISFGF